MRYWRLSAGVVAIVLSSRWARADIRVERTDDAKACPDSAGLVEQIRALAGNDSIDPTAADIDVQFERTNAGFRASMRVGNGNLRTLVDAAPSCDGLADATAVALRLALDLRAAQRESAPFSSPVEPSPPPKHEASAAGAGSPRSPAAADLSAAAVLAVGVTAPVAPGLRAGVALSPDASSHWSLGVTGVVLSRQSKDVGGGTVELSAQGAGVEGCRRSWTGRSVRFAFCGRIEVIRVAGEATGISRSEARARALAMGTLVGRLRAPVAGPVEVFADVGVTAIFVRHRFSIDDEIAYDPPVLAGETGIGMALHFE